MRTLFSTADEVSRLIAQSQSPKRETGPASSTKTPQANPSLIKAASLTIEYLDQDLHKRTIACFKKMRALINIKVEDKKFQSLKESCKADLGLCQSKFKRLSTMKQNLYQSKLLETPKHSNPVSIRPTNKFIDIEASRLELIEETKKRIDSIRKKLVLENLDFLLNLMVNHDDSSVKETLTTILKKDYRESISLCPNLRTLGERSSKLNEYEALRDREDKVKDLCISIGQIHNLSLEEVVNLVKNLDQAKSEHSSIGELKSIIPEYDELFSNFLTNLECLKNIKGIDKLILDCQKQLDQCKAGNKIQPVLLGAFAEADFNRKLIEQGFEIKRIGATFIADKARIINSQGEDLLANIDFSKSNLLEQLKRGGLVSEQAKVSNRSVKLDGLDDRLYINLVNGAVNDNAGSSSHSIAVELPNGNYGFYEIDAVLQGNFVRESGESLSGTFYVEHKASPASFLLKNPINEFLNDSSIVMQGDKMMQVAKAHQAYPIVMSDFDEIYDSSKNKLRDLPLTREFAKAIQFLQTRYAGCPPLIILNHDGKELSSLFTEFSYSA